MDKASIHGNGNRFAKAKHIKDIRTIAKRVAIDQTNGFRLSKACRSEIVYSFFVPDLIKRDEANMIQACKPIVDGIVDAGIIAGDSWDLLNIAGVYVELDRDDPRVEIDLYQVKEG